MYRGRPIGRESRRCGERQDFFNDLQAQTVGVEPCRFRGPELQRLEHFARPGTGIRRGSGCCRIVLDAGGGKGAQQVPDRIRERARTELQGAQEGY